MDCLENFYNDKDMNTTFDKNDIPSLKNLNNKEYIKGIVIKFFEINKTNKQLKNIKNKELGSKIFKYLLKQITDIFIDFNEIYKIIFDKKFRNKFYDDYYKVFEMYNDQLDLFMVKIMDAYLVLRMFRNYSKGLDNKNIIIFSGASHTINYKKLFDYLKFDTETYQEFNKGDTNQKVDIGELEQPLFQRKIYGLKN